MPTRQDGRRWSARLTRSIERRDGAEQNGDIETSYIRASLEFANTYGDAASMLCKEEDEVRQKAKS
jgi:hypothetical protein